MSFRESLYRRAPSTKPDWLTIPSLGRLADWTEYTAFVALTGAILSVAGKGIGVALGLVPLLSFGVFFSVFIGLLIVFLSLIVLAVLLDGGHEYRQFVKELNERRR